MPMLSRHKYFAIIMRSGFIYATMKTNFEPGMHTYNCNVKEVEVREQG